MVARIPIDRRQIEAFCRQHDIRKLSLFGSVLREDFSPESDVDVLVEFEPGRTPGFELFDLQEELSRMFQRQVDLHTPGSLSRYFREEVVANAAVQYVREG